MVAVVAELDQGRRRSVEVRVKLSPALAEAFSAIAEARGLLPATLAASALGEYVEGHQQQASIARMVALDAGKRLTATMTDPESLAKILQVAVADPKIVAAFSSIANPEGE